MIQGEVDAVESEWITECKKAINVGVTIGEKEIAAELKEIKSAKAKVSMSQAHVKALASVAGKAEKRRTKVG